DVPDRGRRLAERVHAQLGEPRPPAQVGVVRGLEARLADAVARPEPALLAPVELRLRDLADVAEELRGQHPARVLARVGLDDLDAREVAMGLLEEVDEPLVHADAQDHRGDRISTMQLDLMRDARERDAEDSRELLQLTVRALLREVGGPEADERLALV